MVSAAKRALATASVATLLCDQPWSGLGQTIAGLVHDGDTLSWREEPFHAWDSSNVLISQLDPSDYPVNCSVLAVPCLGSVDLSVDAHASLCSNVIDGDVVVSGALKYPAYCLREVINGNVMVKNNALVSAMTGFGNLVSVNGDLILEDNPHLVSLQGLEALESVGGNVEVRRCGAPLSLSRLDQMVVDERWEQNLRDSRVPDEQLHLARRRGPAGGVARSRGHALSTGLYREDSLAGLASLHGLASLRSVGGDLVLDANPELLELHGLDNLVSVSGSVIVKANLKLTSLVGAALLADIGGLVADWNPALLSMDGLLALARIGAQGVLVSRNEVLEQIGHLPSLVSIDGDVTVWQNPRMLAPTLQVGAPALRFIGVQAVSGFVSIEDNRRINSLAGLASLETIGSDLFIIRNDALLDLSGGLETLRDVGGDVYVQGGMPTYTGLDSLTTIRGSFVIHGTYDLESVEGLGALRSVGKNLVVHLNPKLESLAEMAALETVGERLEVYGNPALTNIDAMLESLTAVGNFVKIDYANGTIDCPQGTGLGAGDIPLIHDTTTADLASLGSPDARTFGNWCTFNCRYPRQWYSPENHRMWECRENKFWSASWGVLCI